MKRSSKAEKKNEKFDSFRKERKKRKKNERKRRDELFNISMDLKVAKEKAELVKTKAIMRADEFIRGKFDLAERRDRFLEMQMLTGDLPTSRGYGLPVISPRGTSANGLSPVMNSRGFHTSDDGTNQQYGVRQLQSTSSFATRNFQSPNSYFGVEETTNFWQQDSFWTDTEYFKDTKKKNPTNLQTGK